MNVLRIKALVVLVLCVLAYAGAAAWTPTRHLADQRPRVSLEDLFPKAFDGWALDDRVPVQLVSPDTQAVLDSIYDQVLSRTYVHGVTGERVMLSVAYGGDQSDATRAHRPEVCYPAQGFQVVSMTNTRIDTASGTIPARQMVARLGGRNEPVTYWIVVGERITLSGTAQKLAQLAYSTRGVIPDGMLVRVSSLGADNKLAYGLQQQFISSMTLAMPESLRPRVLGAGGA